MARIKSTDFVSDEAKQKATIEALGALLDTFAKEMGAKAFDLIQENPSAWEDPIAVNGFRKQLLTSFENGDMVSVATLAMIAWNLQGTQNE